MHISLGDAIVGRHDGRDAIDVLYQLVPELLVQRELQL
jgi:hypothetical protein